MKIVKITWVDSTSIRGGWMNDIDYELMPITTVGHLISKDRDKVIITHSVGRYKTDDCNAEDYYDIYLIPRGCIKSIETIG